MILRVAAKPSMPGSWISIVITSGRSRCAAATASSPLRAVPITRTWGSAVSIPIRNSRTTAESSTISTLITGRLPGSKEPADHVQQVALVEAALHQVGVGPGGRAPRAIFARFQRCDQHDEIGRA